MKIKSRLFSLIGASVLGLALTTSFAAASPPVDSNSVTASVDISCLQPMTVEITSGNAVFAAISDSFNVHDTSTGPGAIQIKVDMGCYWGPWQVDAKASNFHDGSNWFSSNHLSLRDATVDTYALSGVDILGILEPDANNAYFSGPNDRDTILETNESFLWWLLTGDPDAPAPFVTTASYTGVLSNLPASIPSGTYSSTLTVILTAD